MPILAKQPTDAPGPDAGSTTYRDILRSTAVIGGSSLVVMVISLLRMKILAVLLGPTGVGLFALYGSIADLAGAIAGMGVQQSGVRQIAQAAAREAGAQLTRTAATVNRLSIVLGCVGAIGVAALCLPISLLTFATPAYALPVGLVGIVVFFKLQTGGPMALIQGTRRIPELARLNILGALAGVSVTVPLVLILGEAGIVPALIAASAATSALAWLYGRRITSGSALRAHAAFNQEARELLRLGMAFMISGVLTMAAAYLIRIIIVHADGLAAAGMYQAAWAVAGLYVGFVLQSMGMDFYPRLAGVADDTVTVNRMVNEQTQVSLLLAGPGVLATLTLAPLVISIFYSQAFSGAVGLLRWLCLGMMLRVLAWPMGYIIVAKGWQQTFIWVEVAASLAHIGLAAILVPIMGSDGAGLAFAGLYAYHTILIHWIVTRRCGFRLSRANVVLLVVFGSSTALAFTGFLLLPFWWATGIGLVLTGACGLFSLYWLLRLTPAEVFPAPLRSFLGMVGVR